MLFVDIIGKPTYLSMPEFLAGCHYNEEKTNRHLKENIGYWLIQTNDNKFATDQILEKPVEIMKGRILAGGGQKSPEPWGACVLHGWRRDKFICNNALSN